MTELGKAYVQIVPSADGIKGAVEKVLGPEVESAGNNTGNSFAKKFCDIAVKAIGALGFGKLIGESLNQGGQLQQSLGGVETMFKDSSDKVKEFASQAFQTTGLSANEYMQSVTGFSASLLQSLGGDTDKAAEIANMAMIDMSDNANKMGTDMGAIQSAYQGFAKQNYTMLDNLKLGYGGTKTEMERLLKDAQELTGVEYNIDNLSDVYEAIHAIQKQMDISGYSTEQLSAKLRDMSLTGDELSKVAADMGISYDEALQMMNSGTLSVKDAQVLLGTTAKEAATTLEGSFNSMKAAWTDLLGQMALGGDLTVALGNLTDTVSTWLFGNFLPMVGNILSQIPTLVVGAVQGITTYADEFIYTGVDMVINLVTGIIKAIPEILAAAAQLCESLWNAITSVDWGIVGSEIMSVFNSGIFDEVPEILGTMVELLTTMVTTILDHLPDFLAKGVEIITSMVNGIAENLPSIISAILNVLLQMRTTILQHLPEFLQKGIELIGELAVGLIQAIPKVLGAIPQIISAAVKSFTSYDWPSIGMNIIKGVVNGLINFGSMIAETLMNIAKNAFDSVLSFFGIHSPSTLFRDMIGENIAKGWAEGIEDNADYVTKAMDDMAAETAEIPIEHELSYNAAALTNTGSLSATNYGGLTFNIYTNEFDDKRALANYIKDVITSDTISEEAVFA